VGGFFTDALGGIITADMNQTAGAVSSFFGQFSLGGLFKSFGFITVLFHPS
jgi:hypothetical protein